MRTKKELDRALEISEQAREQTARTIQAEVDAEKWDVLALHAQAMVRIETAIRDLEWMLGIRDQRQERRGGG